MKLLKRFLWRFKTIPYLYIRKLAHNETKQFECEKILGDRKIVRDFAKFFEENEEDFRYLSFIFQHKLENSALSFIKFFQACVDECDLYRIETDRKLSIEKMEEYNQARKDKDREKQEKIKKELDAINRK